MKNFIICWLIFVGGFVGGMMTNERFVKSAVSKSVKSKNVDVNTVEPEEN